MSIELIHSYFFKLNLIANLGAQRSARGVYIASGLFGTPKYTTTFDLGLQIFVLIRIICMDVDGNHIPEDGHLVYSVL